MAFLYVKFHQRDFFLMGSLYCPLSSRVLYRSLDSAIRDIFACGIQNPRF